MQKAYVCRSCGGRLEKIYSFGKMPLANAFLTRREIKTERRYDLSIGVCIRCKLLQLISAVSPKKLFSQYIYRSSQSKKFITHCFETAKYLVKRFSLGKKSFIFEIASNDGTQLLFYKEMGMKVLGIDPAENISKLARQKGIPTVCDFFNKDTALHLQKKGIRPDIIIGTNILAHVPDIRSFVRGITYLLPKTATAVFEFPYLQGLFEGKIDIIYHEHCFYFSLTSLDLLFHSESLEIYDVEFTPLQGGSLRIYVSHPKAYSISEKKRDVLTKERHIGYRELPFYRKLPRIIKGVRDTNLRLIQKLKTRGKHIAVYGAPAKGIALLNFLGLTHNEIDFIVDTLKSKQGLYIPGLHMRVYSPKEVMMRNLDYLLLLCWNLKEEALPKLASYRNRGGKVIIPVPHPTILS